MASDLSSFEEFCGNSPFWNKTLLLDSSYPTFTECFKQVALAWVPCMLFLVITPIYVRFKWLQKDDPLAIGFLNIAKMVCSVALFAVTIITIIVRASDDDQESIADALYVSEGVKAACFIVTTALIQLDRRKGCVESPLMWYFYLVLVLCSIIPFYSNIEEDLQDDDNFGYVIFFVYFSFLFAAFILGSFAETRNKSSSDSVSSGGPTPELDASMPNRISLWWLTGLVYNGYKRPLEEKDVFDLHPADRSDKHTPTFEKKWEAELAKVKEYNEDIRRQQSRLSSSKTYSFERKLNEKTPLLSSDEKAEKKSPYRKASLLGVLLKMYGVEFIAIQLMRTAFDLLQFLTPKLTESILDYITFEPMYYEWRGYCLAGGYAVILTISSLGSNYAAFLSRRIGINMKSVLMNAVYKKSMTVSNIGDDSSSGEMINLLATDCQKFEEVAPWIYFFIAAPFQVALAIYMLYDQMEEATFAGMGMLFLALPFNAAVGASIGKNQIAMMQYKDERMKTTTEVINGVKVLKLYAWEGSFEEKITAIREKELKAVKNMQLAISMIYLIFGLLPIMVQLTSFAVYIAISDEGYLSPTVASVSMQLFALLNLPLTVMPVTFPFCVQAYISIGRLSEYLNRTDIDPNVVTHDRNAVNAVEIKDGEFTWDHSQQPTLQDINVAIKPGSLVAVVGPVGCGKSSLLSAMMGEMVKLNGDVALKESIAYVAQEAWIQNATVRDNILFGSKYDRLKYDKIIRACSLKSDLDILPGGDQTEIGEKGINISGGQKQRVSLARAIYSDNSIYLLDDPLSAVDSHVGKHIFKHVISSRGILKDKTRILVTHGIHWLPMVDSIIVMKDGRISEVGSYEDLMSTNGVLAQFLQEHIQEGLDSEREDQTDPEVESMRRTILKRVESVTGSAKEGTSSGEELGALSGDKPLRQRKQSQSRKPESRPSLRRGSSLAPLEAGLVGRSVIDHGDSLSWKRVSISAGAKLIEEEKEGSGKVKWDTYWYYFKAAGLKTVIAGIILYTANAGARFFSGVWLTEWTSDDLLLNTSRSDEDDYDETTTRYMIVYGAVGISQGIFVLIFAVISAVQLTLASKILHSRVLGNILRLPMAFFDTTPGGRIINRFSRDIDIIDMMFPSNLKQILDGLSQILGTILTISYGTPSFLFGLGPLAILYIVVMVLYVPTSRQLRRLEAVTRSPVLAHFAETINGASSIRAYRSQDRFLGEFRRRVDNNMRFYFAGISAQIWVLLRLQLLSGMVTFAAAFFAVASSVSPSKAGVSISYATQMTAALQVLVDNVSQAESNVVSIERLKEYAEEKREADWVNPRHRPKPKWPESGNIVFQNYQTRYRPGLDLVLKDISCDITGGQKIGIVGRTGAGKSSMTVALFRLIESAGGQIIIDDETISTLGLHDLRSQLTILPQEPVIFSGTLRMNLDPFDNASDEGIWHALEHCHLKEFVKGLPTGLNYECGEGGSNLSVGQRQLLCLGRTLLRKTKVLVLDEATAAVDLETDELIQETIRKEFKESTVLTIAHRLNTIMDYDKIMVLDNGFLSEFDSPGNLLSNKATIFYGMARDAGLVT